MMRMLRKTVASWTRRSNMATQSSRVGWPRRPGPGSEIQLISVSDSSNPPTVRILPLLYGKLQRKAFTTQEWDLWIIMMMIASYTYMNIIIMIMIASYTDDDDRPHDHDFIVHGWQWLHCTWMMMNVIMIMIKSYTDDEDHIVHGWWWTLLVQKKWFLLTCGL